MDLFLGRPFEIVIVRKNFRFWFPKLHWIRGYRTFDSQENLPGTDPKKGPRKDIGRLWLCLYRFCPSRYWRPLTVNALAVADFCDRPGTSCPVSMDGWTILDRVYSGVRENLTRTWPSGICWPIFDERLKIKQEYRRGHQGNMGGGMHSLKTRIRRHIRTIERIHSTRIFRMTIFWIRQEEGTGAIGLYETLEKGIA